MKQRIFTQTRVPFSDYFFVSKAEVEKRSHYGSLSGEDKAREITQVIKRRVKDDFSTFDGHQSQPIGVMAEFTGDVEEIVVTVFFDDADAAMLWKLTHGGAA